MVSGDDLLTIERALQVALAPAFVIGGVMAILNLLNTRLQRIADREREARKAGASETALQRPMLRRRARLVHGAMFAAIISAVALSLLVIVSFVEPLFGVGAGAHVVALLIFGMAMLTVALVLFFLEILAATGGLDRGEL